MVQDRTWAADRLRLRAGASGWAGVMVYTAELDFKYNTRKETDGQRTSNGIRRIEGKRLMYRPKAGS